MPPFADDTLKKFRAELERLYGERLERVVLYGSRARGDARPDSDYDVAVFLKGLNTRWDEIDKIIGVTHGILVDTGALIYAMPFRAGAYIDRTPLMHELRHEGKRRLKPELADFLDKARQCLASGQGNLSIRQSNDAGRNAYLTVFHAAQAYIFAKTGKIAKTHNGVHALFGRLAAKDGLIPRDLQIFISQAYDLKAVADYEMGKDSLIPLERSTAAIHTAEAFLDCIVSAIEKADFGKDE